MKKEAINECIEENVLRDFLLEQKAEVITMSIYEYNEEYVKRVLYEDGYEEGKAESIIDFLEERGKIPEDVLEKIQRFRIFQSL